MELTRLVDESSVAGAVLAGPRPSGVAMLAGQPSSVVDIRSITYDSRRVGDNTLFVCVAGLVVDGHDFAEAAVAAGAVALVVERVLPIDVPQVLVADARVAMASLAATLYGSPSQGLTVIGVTGTNGKTTTVHLLDSVLREHGWATGVIGTLTGVRTTPEAPELQAQLAAWRDDGRQAVTMEVSSHALALHRVDAMRFAVAVFTNLSRDHLDFHGTMKHFWPRAFANDVAVPIRSGVFCPRSLTVSPPPREASSHWRRSGSRCLPLACVGRCVSRSLPNSHRPSGSKPRFPSPCDHPR